MFPGLTPPDISGCLAARVSTQLEAMVPSMICGSICPETRDDGSAARRAHTGAHAPALSRSASPGHQAARSTIPVAYAQWTALSAMRSRAPIKFKTDAYPVLRGSTFAQLCNPQMARARSQSMTPCIARASVRLPRFPLCRRHLRTQRHERRDQLIAVPIRHRAHPSHGEQDCGEARRAYPAGC